MKERETAEEWDGESETEGTVRHGESETEEKVRCGESETGESETAIYFVKSQTLCSTQWRRRRRSADRLTDKLTQSESNTSLHIHWFTRLHSVHQSKNIHHHFTCVHGPLTLTFLSYIILHVRLFFTPIYNLHHFKQTFMSTGSDVSVPRTCPVGGKQHPTQLLFKSCV